MFILPDADGVAAGVTEPGMREQRMHRSAIRDTLTALGRAAAARNYEYSGPVSV